jgi:mannose-6-phosphate isomerase-like protein (cupin superfamily)
MDVIDLHRHRGEFFRVLTTSRHSQTAVMTIAPGQDAGPPEQHGGDQIIYVIDGEAAVTIGGHVHTVAGGALVTVPATASHHVKNTGATPLFFLTVYAPPEYEPTATP